jgi:lipopolysaccharide biosynthesis protein
MKICLFSSYSKSVKIDNYIKFYLEMLKAHFDKVILITNHRNINKKDLDFLIDINVSIKFVDNEGYDFGMWYKALQDINKDNFEQIAFVNDSCILFNSLDKVMNFVNNCDYDFCGITDSKQISYHLQSYFTVAKGRKCINAIYNYYESNGIINSDEVRDVINTYEIGMPKFLMDNKLKVGSMFKCEDYPNSPNICLMNAKDIINKECPMIKKKLIYKTFRDHERSFLEHHGFDFNFDYITRIKNIIYPYNISIHYLLDV